MSTIEEALTAAVAGEGSISALIGDRFFLIGSRQKASLPYVTFQRISTQGAAYLDGDANLEWPRFQMDVWAATGAQALTIAAAIRAFLCSTPSADLSGAGLTFSASFQDQRGPTLDDETRNYGCSQDYFLWHNRS